MQDLKTPLRPAIIWFNHHKLVESELPCSLVDRRMCLYPQKKDSAFRVCVDDLAAVGSRLHSLWNDRYYS